MTMKGGVYSVMEGLKPVILMVTVQISFVGINVLYKLALNDGMNLRIVIAYRFLFATAFTTPLALILERKKRAKMTWTILFQSFLCGLFGGALAQNLYLEALHITSATFAAAMGNLTPAITFIMASSIGMERLNLRKASGKAKIIGTLTGIGGAMVLTLVKGVEIHMGSLFHLNLMHPNNNNHNHNHNHNENHSGSISSGGRTILGALCVLASNVSYALWLIIQTKMSERYPRYYTSTALMSVWGAIISILFALCFESETTDLTQWRLGWNIRLLTVAYAGIVVSGVMVVVISWCVRMRGPLFASVFSPLMLVMVAFAGSTMLNEKLYLGSIVGAMLIVCGLYLVLWGKSKEMKMKNQLVPSNCPHDDAVESDDTVVEVVVRPKAVEQYYKSNHDNNNIQHVNGANLVRDDQQDSSQNRPEEEEHHRQVHNQVISREEGSEQNQKEDISSNASRYA